MIDTSSSAVVNRSQSSSLLILTVTNHNSGVSYDIRQVFTELNIYASIDDVITSGDVTIMEQGNMINTLPLDGRDYIEIKFNSLEGKYEDYHRLFFIYAVDNMTESKDKRKYTIRFTDILGMLNPDIRLSITYNQETEKTLKELEEIIENPEMGFEDYKQILNNHSSIPTGNRMFPFVENNELSINTEYPQKIVVPNWHPLQLIKFLTSRSISTDSASLQEYKFCDCVFFQNRKGEYILSNYKKMFNTPLKDKSGQNIEPTRLMGNTMSSAEDKTYKEGKYQVVNYTFNKMFNVQYQKQFGFFGFTDCITDFVMARCEPITVQDEEIQSCILQYGIVNKQQPYEAIKKTENGVILYDACGMNMSYKDDEYNNYTLPYLKGMVLRAYIENAKIFLEMNGVSDIDIGHVIRINLGRDIDESITCYVNESPWIVSKYSHQFLADGTYKTIIECYTPYVNRKENVSSATEAREIV